MIIPTSYKLGRNRSNAYTRGYQAGQRADLGGVPLAPYTKPTMVLIFEAGFEAAQREKGQPAATLPADEAPRAAILPPPVPPGLFGRERQLLAFLEQIRKDIDAMLGVR